MSECPLCDCEQVAWAAPLGSLWHACCRACGMMYTFTPEECDGDDSEVADYVKG